MASVWVGPTLGTPGLLMLLLLLLLLLLLKMLMLMLPAQTLLKLLLELPV